MGTAVLRETLDTSVKTPDEAVDIVGAPLLGAINFDAKAAKSPLVVVSEPDSVRAEAFRQLRTNLQFVDIEHPLKSVVITSSLPGEGKSTTACNLAISLAQAGLKVILVEADLRRPRVGDYLGVESAVGVTSVLLGRVTLDDALQQWGGESLHVLGSGPLPPNPSELLGSSGMLNLLRELEGRADLVVIDAPPLLPVTDAAVLGTAASGVLLVIQSNATRREQVARAVSTVTSVGATLLGSVMNRVPLKGPNAYAYGYGYGYDYTRGPAAGRLTRDESIVLGGLRHDPPVESTPTEPPSAEPAVAEPRRAEPTAPPSRRAGPRPPLPRRRPSPRRVSSRHRLPASRHIGAANGEECSHDPRRTHHRHHRPGRQLPR